MKVIKKEFVNEDEVGFGVNSFNNGVMIVCSFLYYY